MKRRMRAGLRALGLDIVRYPERYASIDLGPGLMSIYPRVRPYTMTTPARIYALMEAVQYLTECRIAGSFVECGVWRGGSVMAMALTLLHLGSEEREIFLYDTFAGMPRPTKHDRTEAGRVAESEFQEKRLSEVSSEWCLAPLEEVMKNVVGTGYPKEAFHFVEGMVEDTIPGRIPERIALLRLDTDWYRSTKHELNHLFPRLVEGGVLILDDYGHWEGARRAVDEYFTENDVRVWLRPMDRVGRLAIKTGGAA